MQRVIPIPFSTIASAGFAAEHFSILLQWASRGQNPASQLWIYQSLRGNLEYDTLVAPAWELTSGISWKAISLGRQVLLPLNSEAASPQDKSRTTRSPSRFTFPTWHLFGFRAGAGWATPPWCPSFLFGDPLNSVILLRWLQATNGASPPSSLSFGCPCWCACCSLCRHSPSFSLFVPCQVSGTEGDPEPCHLE